MINILNEENDKCYGMDIIECKCLKFILIYKNESDTHGTMELRQVDVEGWSDIQQNTNILK